MSVSVDTCDKVAPAIPDKWLEHLRRRSVHAAEGAAFIVAMAFFACLPVDWASAIGGYIAQTLGLRTGLSRRALRNLRCALPENSDAENDRILRGMWDNLGRSVGEYPHLAWICSAKSHRVEIVNGDAVAHLMMDGAPSIIFGGHFGNWEVGPSTVHRLMGSLLLSIYRAANNPWIDRLLRRRLGPRRAVAKGPRAGRELLRHLRWGGCVAMLIDQKMNDGIAVPFFGRDAMTAPAIARLGLRFGCAIVPIRTERLKGARFRLTLLPPIETANTGDPDLDVLTTLTRINATIEGWVRARPEQWLWIHRRWPN